MLLTAQPKPLNFILLSRLLINFFVIWILSFSNAARRRLSVLLLFHSLTWFFTAVVIRFVLSLWYSIKLNAAYWQKVSKTHRPSDSIKVDCVALHVFISVLKKPLFLSFFRCSSFASLLFMNFVNSSFLLFLNLSAQYESHTAFPFVRKAKAP